MACVDVRAARRPTACGGRARPLEDHDRVLKSWLVPTSCDAWREREVFSFLKNSKKHPNQNLLTPCTQKEEEKEQEEREREGLQKVDDCTLLNTSARVCVCVCVLVCLFLLCCGSCWGGFIRVGGWWRGESSCSGEKKKKTLQKKKRQQVVRLWFFFTS